VFDLSDMQLDILPLDIITLFPNITGLYIDKNSVTKIPFEFHVMTQLVLFFLEGGGGGSLCPWGLVYRGFPIGGGVLGGGGGVF